MPSSINTVFFDLDGTLADTAPDLTAALNQLLTEHDKPSLTLSEVLPEVSKGGMAMLRLGFEFDETSDEYATLRQRFLDIYQQRLHTDTQLFEGMEETLTRLEKAGFQWGIITNKNTWLTEPLIKKLGLHERTACLVCGDTAEQPKPHPAPVLYACDLLGINTNQAVYIGDARNDVKAAHAAGMDCIVALYGYIPVTDKVDDWQADAAIHHPLELFDWLDSANGD